ncbi:MAG: DUF4124 domain-containing protein [Gammaproteobacteria bacterium]|nr:DUF4124 domain-containing protein [Gammaproteobacteria bacterium]
MPYATDSNRPDPENGYPNRRVQHRKLSASRIVFLLLICVVSTGNSAAVYRWVDENGRVQFGDRPPRDKEVNQITIKTAPTPSSTAPAPSTESVDTKERLEKQQRMLDAYRDERFEKQAESKERKKQEEDRARECAYARDRLSRYQGASSIYEPMPDGTERTLSDEERKSTIAGTQRAIERLCR